MIKSFRLLLVGVVAVGLAAGATLASLQPASAPGNQAAAQTRVGAQATPGLSEGNRVASKDLTGATAAGQAGQTGPRAGQGFGQAGTEGRSMPVAGSVVSVEGNVLTLDTQQGEVKVKLDDATIQKTVEGTAEDLKEGERVMVSGQREADGSYTANFVQITPAGESPTQPMRRAPAQATPDASPSPR